MIERWNKLSSRAQRTWIGVAVVVGIFVVLNGLNSIGGRPGGPSLSSYATAPEGLAALDSLLERNGYPTTQVRVGLDEAELPSDATVVALGQVLSRTERRAMRAFVERGGRLLTGGPEAEPFLRSIDEGVRWRAEGFERLRPVANPAVPGLATVTAAGFGVWADPPGVPLFEGRSRDAGFVLPVGRGTVVALADPSPLTNALLGEADNAGLALVTVGPTAHPVQFAENGHGYGLDAGLGAIPSRWKTALWFAAFAGLVGALAAGKRFGPVDVEPEAPAPERSAYVGAVASTLARTRDIDAAAAPLRARGTAAVLRRAGRVVTPDDLADAARLAGLNADEVRSLTEPISTDAELVALGRTVSRLEER